MDEFLLGIMRFSSFLILLYAHYPDFVYIFAICKNINLEL